MALVGRGLKRRPVRAAMLVMAVGMAVALLVSLQSLAAGFLAAQTAELRDRPVDVLLQAPATRGDLRQTGLPPPGILDAHALSARLDARDGIASASPTLEALLVTRDRDGAAVQVVAQGVIPGDHAEAMSPAQRAKFDGYFSASDDPRYANGSYAGPRSGEVVVSRGLAERLGLARGDFAAFAPSPTENATQHRVVGIFESPFTGTGTVGGVHVALFPLAELQERVGVDARDAATRIALRLDDDVRRDGAATERVLAALAADHPGLDVLTKEEELQSARERAAVSAGFYTAVAYVSLVVSALFVASVMIMEVQERRRDLGVLRAIGFSRASVFRDVALEALALVAMGTAVGLLVGWAGSEALSSYFRAGYGLDVDFTDFTPGLALLSAAQSLVVGVLAALYPAWLASRVDPLRILRTAR